MSTQAQSRHIDLIVAELDACRTNAQPGGKYGGPPATPSWLTDVRPWEACSVCGTRQPLRADGHILGHGPYGNRCPGSYRAPADPGGAA